MPEENNDSENPKVDENSDSSIGTEIKKKLENEFAKNLFPLIQKYKQELSTCEDNLLTARADYQNLERRSNIEVSQKILQQKNQLMLEFAVIYEDFIRAKSALENESVSIQGLEAIIKKMKSLLNENHIEEIEAKKGKPFDRNYHEAISTVEDNSLDDDTIIEEVAKGYISSGKVIKYSKVIVSKKNEKGEMKNG
jgi:molecular chaperone GrpE